MNISCFSMSVLSPDLFSPVEFLLQLAHRHLPTKQSTTLHRHGDATTAGMSRTERKRSTVLSSRNSVTILSANPFPSSHWPRRVLRSWHFFPKNCVHWSMHVPIAANCLHPVSDAIAGYRHPKTATWIDSGFTVFVFSAGYSPCGGLSVALSNMESGVCDLYQVPDAQIVLLDMYQWFPNLLLIMHTILCMYVCRFIGREGPIDRFLQSYVLFPSLHSALFAGWSRPRDDK